MRLYLKAAEREVDTGGARSGRIRMMRDGIDHWMRGVDAWSGSIWPFDERV